ncbi:MAG: CsbD family protein [Acidobacteria bacterium]|nr:MAG: CsbD family protein [Acidobacteriota bacterium]
MVRAKFNRHFNRLLCGEILTRWEQLTSAEIDGCGADRAKLIDVLQARYGYAKRRAEKEVALFISEFQERLRLAA